jgi:hypothetical protein
MTQMTMILKSYRKKNIVLKKICSSLKKSSSSSFASSIRIENNNPINVYHPINTRQRTKPKNEIENK